MLFQFMLKPTTSRHDPLDEDTGILGRALLILNTVAESPEPLANRELTALTGIPKATVSRITARLTLAGLLRQPRNTEHFALGPGVLDLSRAFLDKLDVRAEFRRRFPVLVENIGAAVHLGLRDRLDMVLLDTVQPRAATLITRLRAGSRMSLANSALGRAYLCALPTEEREAVAQSLYQSGVTEPISLAKQLQIASEELASQGFCTSFGEWNPEIHAVATWLQAPDGELLGISCGGPAYQLTRPYLLNDVLPPLRQAVQWLCQDTGATSAAHL